MPQPMQAPALKTQLFLTLKLKVWLLARSMGTTLQRQQLQLALPVMLILRLGA